MESTAEAPLEQPLTLPAVRGLEKTSDAFKRKLIAVAGRLGIDPGYLAAVISFESAGTFSPSEPNLAGSGAVGLIQFMPGPHGSAALLGTTTQALAAMTAERQLDFVEEFYRRVLGGRRVTELRDVYLCVIASGYVLSPPGTVIYDKTKDPVRYERNKNLDLNHDDKITAEEAATPVQEILRYALSRPPLVVPPAPPEGNGVETVAAVLLGFATLCVFLYNARHGRTFGHV